MMGWTLPLPSALARLLCLHTILGLVRAECFYPDGSPAENNVPCRDGPDSACCSRDAICLDNNLCLSVTQPTGISRGSCTDKTFGSDECADVCTNIQPSTDCPIVPYNRTSTEEGGTYCCGQLTVEPTSGRPTCLEDSEPFRLSSILPGFALLEDYIRNDAQLTKTAQPNHDVKIGVGVGVPLGIMSLLSIGWALYERGKRMRSESAEYGETMDEASKSFQQEALSSQPSEIAELGSVARPRQTVGSLASTAPSV